MSTSKKYTVELSAELDAALSDLARRQHMAKAQVIRRAIALMDYFDTEARTDDQRIGITDSAGNLKREVIL